MLTLNVIKPRQYLCSKISNIIIFFNRVFGCVFICAFIILWPSTMHADPAEAVTIDNIDNKTHAFEIGSLALEDALTRLAQQADVQILFRSDYVSGFKVEPLVGNYSLRDALQKLLSNTPLEFKLISSTTIAIVQKANLTPENIVEKPKALRSTDKIPVLAEVVVVGESRAVSCCRNIPSTATKTFTPTIDVPKSLEGIDAELFRDRGNATLSEAFRDYSSINVTDVQGNINIRGFKLSDREILKDGQPVVSHGLTPLTLYNIEGIEIAKGANSTLYGYGQPGGVVNLITKKPTKFAFTNATLSYGNYDKYFALDTNSKSPFNEDLLQRLNLLVREQGENSNHDFIRQLQASPSLNYQIDDRQSLHLSMEYSHQEAEGYQGVRPFDDAELNTNVGDFQLLDIAYGDLNIPVVDVYPYNGNAKDNYDSKTADVRIDYQVTTENDWNLTTNLYAGTNYQDQHFLNDLIIYLNPIFDPHVHPAAQNFPLAYLTNLFSTSNSGFYQNYTDAQAEFQSLVESKYGIQPQQAISVFFNGGRNFPLWTDETPHFYQQAFDVTEQTKQYNFDFYASKEIDIYNTTHFLLIGTNYLQSTTQQTADLLYNKELYDQGSQYLIDSPSNNDLFLGSALRRYALYPSYTPYQAGSSEAIQLPTQIANLTGLAPEKRYALNSAVEYLRHTSETNTFGLYLQDQIFLNENWKLLFSGGWYQFKRKIEKVEQNNYISASIGEFVDIPSIVDVKDNFFAPQTGLLYSPLEDLSLYVNYGKQFNIIDEQELNGAPFKPEDTTTYETGLKWWPTKTFNFSFSVFEITKNNWSISNRENNAFHVQQGKFRSSGVELSLAGFVSPHIKTALNFTEIEQESLKHPEGGRDTVFLDSNKLGVPDNSGSLWIQYHSESYSNLGWSFGIGANYMGERQYDQQTVVAHFDRYTLYDAAVAFRNTDFLVALNVDNLTNEAWLVGSSITPHLFQNSRFISEGYGVRYRLTSELFF